MSQNLVGMRLRATAVIGFEDQPIDWAPARMWTTADGVRHQDLSFIVPGTPKPKGNVIKGRYGGYHDATKGLDDWLAVISAQAQAAMSGGWRKRELRKDFTPNMSDIGPVNDQYFRDLTAASLDLFISAVQVIATFVLPRPKSTIIDGKRWDLSKNPTPPHTKKPDCDKLFRAVGDAMTGIVFLDDAQIVDAKSRKRYAYLGENTGAIIHVTSDAPMAMEVP